jgi:hypothetical protein
VEDDIAIAKEPLARPEPRTFYSIPHTNAKGTIPSAKGKSKEDHWSVLLASATRRDKATESSSALTILVEEVEGDFEMTDASATALESSLLMPEVDFGSEMDVIDHFIGEVKRNIYRTKVR